jgi:hypothetical protein
MQISFQVDKYVSTFSESINAELNRVTGYLDRPITLRSGHKPDEAVNPLLLQALVCARYSKTTRLRCVGHDHFRYHV